MWQVWKDDRLYGSWASKTQAESVLDSLQYKYPDAKLEIRIYQ